MSYLNSTTSEGGQLVATDLVFVALGSNMPSIYGSPVETVKLAMERLQTLSRAPLRRSSLWLNEAVDCPRDSPEFVNAVVGLLPGEEETPGSLLRKLLELETVFGRNESVIQNAPRPLDLDLICFGNQVVNEVGLNLPHPKAQSRLFVLLPLQEIAPELTLPLQRETVTQLANKLSDSLQAITKIPD